MTVVVAHGGVSGLPRSGGRLADSIARGEGSNTALDAVEAVVVALEDDPLLNAGYGAVLTTDGTIELDAGIMDGATGRAGCVAGVTVRHPISLARRVMDRTPHVFMIGEGAMALGDDMEILAETTPEQQARWQADVESGPSAFGVADAVDTVGAVALDDDGRLAAGSSTGGVFGKRPGRVGDAPVVGAGIYASRDGAAVGTGVGELFLRTLACREAVRLVELGVAPQDACEQIVKQLDGTIGLLVLDREGRVGAAFRGGSWQVEDHKGTVEARLFT
jgi:beta-aspartyl-peptidase (threonine type)